MFRDERVGSSPTRSTILIFNNMAKKTKQTAVSMSADEKKWRIQRNADILREAANMSTQDRKEAENYMRTQIKEMQKIIKQ